MTAQKGRDFLVKIGNGGSPETFATLGAARLVSMTVNNNPADNTDFDGDGFQSFQADAGVQSMEIMLEGIFRDAVAEEALRLSAFNRAVKSYQLLLPNGDMYAAAFVVHDYRRGAEVEGLETFAVTLLRSGAGTFT